MEIDENDIFSALHKIQEFNATILGFENCNLTSIPKSIFKTFPNLKMFIVGSYSDLTDLKSQNFKNANNLKSLDIQGTMISKLEEKVFEKATNLESINLKNNAITSVDVFAFYGLSKLQIIYLGGNDIKELQPMTFSWLFNLEYLDLQGGCVQEAFNLTDTPGLLAINPNSNAMKKRSVEDDEYDSSTEKTTEKELLNSNETSNEGKNIIIDVKTETLERYNNQHNKIKTVEDKIEQRCGLQSSVLYRETKSKDQILDLKLNGFLSELKKVENQTNELIKRDKNNTDELNELRNHIHNNIDVRFNAEETTTVETNTRSKEQTEEKEDLELLKKEVNSLRADNSTKNLMIVAIVLLLVLSCIGGFFVFITVMKIMKTSYVCEDHYQRDPKEHYQRDPEEVKVQVEVFEEETKKMEEVVLNDIL